MNAFDTDVFSEILLGNAAYVSRLLLIPPDQQAIPIIVAEEILRGRLNVIRQAEAGKLRISIDLAYQLFLKRPSATCDGFKSFLTPAKQKLPTSDGGRQAFESRHTTCASQRSAW
jgi:hypothetical protein